MSVALGYSVWTPQSALNSTSVTSVGGTTQSTGSTFIIVASSKPNGSVVTPTISDSNSNTYTLGKTLTHSFGQCQLSIYYCINGTGGASHTATANWGGGNTQKLAGVAFLEFTGVGAGTFDSAPTGIDSTAGSPSVAPTIVTTVANELVFNVFQTFNTGPQTIGDSGGSWAIAANSAASNNSMAGATSYQVVTTSGSSVADSFTYSSFDFTGTLAVSIKPAAGGGNVTLALTGQSGTLTAGTLVQSTSAALTGQLATSSTGLLVPNFAVPLLGTVGTFTAGSVTVPGNVTIALTGQAAAFGIGAFGIVFSVPLVGQSGTGSAGILAPGASTALTGSGSVFVLGTLTPSMAVALLGQPLPGTPGILAPGVTLAALGQASTFSSGLIIPASSIPLTGRFQSIVAGTLIASGGDAVITQVASMLWVGRGVRKNR